MISENIYAVPMIYNSISPKSTPLTVTVPGSKSITNRALLLATLAEGTSMLRGWKILQKLQPGLF